MNNASNDFLYKIMKVTLTKTYRLKVRKHLGYEQNTCKKNACK